MGIKETRRRLNGGLLAQSVVDYGAAVSYFLLTAPPDALSALRARFRRISSRRRRR